MSIKKLVGLASLVYVADAATDKQACMNCKRRDTNSGFLKSWTYCPDKENEQCIENFDRYINQGKKCLSETKEGWELDIDKDCNAEEIAPGACISSFTAPPPNADGTKTDPVVVSSKTLPENGKCTIKIDATAQVARVTITGSGMVGALFPGFVKG